MRMLIGFFPPLRWVVNRQRSMPVSVFEAKYRAKDSCIASVIRTLSRWVTVRLPVFCS